MALVQITLAGPNHIIAGTNHTIAGPNHTVAGPNQAIAGPNHNIAGPNHTIAGPNHKQGYGSEWSLPGSGSDLKSNLDPDPTKIFAHILFLR